MDLADLPSRGVVDFAGLHVPGFEGYEGAVLFRHRLHVASGGQLLTFAPTI